MIDALRENRVRSDKCIGDVHISLFDLEQQRLKLRFQDEADKTQIIDLASVGQNEFNDLLNDVDFFELLFDFTGNEFDPLGSFGPPREFILALGEDEKTVTLDENGAVRFDNLEHLNKLSADDLLTLRLFQSNDAVNVLWEWAFLANIYFVDETGEKVNHDASFSHPNPVVKIGTGSSLNDIQLSDISVSGDTASVTISGRVYCDIADISEDPNADISEVTLLVPRSNTTGGYERITVPVTNVSNIALKDYLPFEPDNLPTSLEEMSHPYVGEFTASVALELTSGSSTVLVEAVNAIGNKGYDSFSVVIADNTNGFIITNVVNNINTGRGLFRPLWMQIEDPLLVPGDIDKATVNVFGEQHPLVERNGKYYANKPFIQVGRALLSTVLANNILSVGQQEERVAEYATSVTGTDLKPVVSNADWSFTAAKKTSNFYKYAAGTTIGINWYSRLLGRGWKVKSVKAFEKTGFIWGLRFSEDLDSIVQPVIADIPPLDTDSIPVPNVDPIGGVRFSLKLGKLAYQNAEKRLEVTLEKDGRTETIKTAYFKVVPLKTIILAIDGFAYDSAIKTINEATYFNQVFKDGVQHSKPALSALPTITWANWPGVFSGNSPAEHGVLGNSYFPREDLGIINTPEPVFSSGNDNKIENIVQPSVALGGILGAGTLVDLSFPGSGSIYDAIAEALGKGGDNRLNVRSVRPFYAKANSDVINLDASFFVNLDLDLFVISNPVSPVGHSANDARILDNGAAELITNPFSITPRIETLGTGPQSVLAWRSNKEEMDIMSLYFPGPDNIGHTLGNANVDGTTPLTELAALKLLENVDVKNPVNVLSAHANMHTDAALGLLVDEIEKDGYLNAVLFAMTADHGQHQFSDHVKNSPIDVTAKDRVIFVEELEPLLESPESDGGLEMQLFRGSSLFQGESINTADIVYSPNGGLGQFYIRTSNNRDFLDENRTWHEPPKTDDIKRVASLLYREAVGHVGYDSSYIVLREDDPATPDINEELKYAELAPVSSVNNSGVPITTNGAFGSPPAIFVKYCDASMGGCSVPVDNAFIQDFKWVENVYLKCDLRIRTVQDETQRAAFIDSFKNEYSIKRKECAAAIVEITGLGDWIISGYSDSSAFQSIAITDTNDPGSSLRNMLDAIPEDRTEEKKDLIKQLSSILNHSILDDYTDIKLGTIDQFLLARQVVVPDLDWPAFKERLDEMNHKNATGSRTGDIVTVMDGRKGYVSVNYEDEAYPGWHGGPTVSESYVPLIFSMPGDSFVDSNGNLIGTPPELITGFNAGVEKAGIKEDGYLRNWHLTPILREIITQFRDD